MRKTILILALGAALLMGCGGSKAAAPDRVLHVNGFDVSESAARLRLRVLLLDPSAVSVCRSLQGLSGGDAAKLLSAVPDSGGATSTPYAAETPVPGQTADPSDLTRMGTIISEECARILKGN